MRSGEKEVVVLHEGGEEEKERKFFKYQGVFLPMKIFKNTFDKTGPFWRYLPQKSGL